MNLAALKTLDDICTPEEVKAKTGVGNSILNKLHKEKILVKVYLSERSYVYRRDEVNAYITSCWNNPEAAKEDIDMVFVNKNNPNHSKASDHASN